ncbi:MAG: hypothetical protein AB1744_13950, partial [Candidatus Zixiibacteriota bacterium]
MANWKSIETWSGTVGTSAQRYSVESWSGTASAGYAVPTSPKLVSPENNAMPVMDVFITFQWENGQYIENHRVEVDNDEDFSSPIDNVTVVGDNRWFKVAGYPAGTYFWRVVAVGLGGENISENTWKFVTIARRTYGTQFAHTANVTYLLDSTSENLSFRFDAIEGKTVDNVRLYVAAVAGAPSYRIGIQADSGGVPSGVFLGSVDTYASVIGWFNVNISDVALTAGNVYHVVIQPLTADGTNYNSFRALNRQNARYPLDEAKTPNLNVVYDDGSGWENQNQSPIFLLNYTDNTFRGVSYSSTAFANVYDIYWQAEKFRPSETMTVDKIRVYIGKGASNPEGNLEWAIRVDGSTTDLYSGTFATPSDAEIPLNSDNWVERDVANFTLTAGTTYRFILRSPTSTLNAWRWYASVTDSAPYLDYTYDNVNSVYSTSSDAPDYAIWSDINARDVPF